MNEWLKRFELLRPHTYTQTRLEILVTSTLASRVVKGHSVWPVVPHVAPVLFVPPALDHLGAHLVVLFLLPSVKVGTDPELLFDVILLLLLRERLERENKYMNYDDLICLKKFSFQLNSSRPVARITDNFRRYLGNPGTWYDVCLIKIAYISRGLLHARIRNPYAIP